MWWLIELALHAVTDWRTRVHRANDRAQHVNAGPLPAISGDLPLVAQRPPFYFSDRLAPWPRVRILWLLATGAIGIACLLLAYTSFVVFAMLLWLRMQLVGAAYLIPESTRRRTAGGFDAGNGGLAPTRGDPSSSAAAPVGAAWLRQAAGNRRMELLLVPATQRSLAWWLQRQLLQLGGIVEYILNARQPLVLFAALTREFGSAFPFCDGLGISHTVRGRAHLYDPLMLKGPHSLGWQVSSAQVSLSPLAGTFLPAAQHTSAAQADEMKRVSQSRAFMFQWLTHMPFELRPLRLVHPGRGDEDDDDDGAHGVRASVVEPPLLASRLSNGLTTTPGLSSAASRGGSSPQHGPFSLSAPSVLSLAPQCPLYSRARQVEEKRERRRSPANFLYRPLACYPSAANRAQRKTDAAEHLTRLDAIDQTVPPPSFLAATSSSPSHGQRNQEQHRVQEQVEALGGLDQVCLAQLLPRRDAFAPPEALVWTYMGNLMLYLGTGGGCYTRQEVEAWVHNVKNPSLFLPDWFNFLVGGGVFERSGLDSFYSVRNALARYPAAFVHLFEFGARQEPPLSKDAVLRGVATLLVTAGVAPSKLAAAVVHRLYAHPAQMVPLFRKSPRAFILECARLDKGVPMVTVLSQSAAPGALGAPGCSRGVGVGVGEQREWLIPRQDMQRTGGGKSGCAVPDGTPLHVSIVSLNRDMAVFGDDAHVFNPDRPSLDQAVSFNGLGADAPPEGADLAAHSSPASRFCLGYHWTLHLVQFVAERFLPAVLTATAPAEPDPPLRASSSAASSASSVGGAASSSGGDEAPPAPARLPSHYVAQLDTYTLTIYLLTAKVAALWNSNPPKAIDLCMPAARRDLQMFGLDFNRTLAAWDEDMAHGDHIERRLGRLVMNSRLLRRIDNDTAFASEADGVEWRRLAFTQLPSPAVSYGGDLCSDAAMSRMAFFGMPCHLTRLLTVLEHTRLPARLRAAGAHYVHDASALEIFRVRAPYERYGALAYFDARFRVVAIWWCDAQRFVYATGASEWGYAKWVWKSSWFALVTIRDHLLLSHLTEANTLAVASRTHLSVHHRIRCFLKPFTFHSITINKQAGYSLVNERGLGNHIWAFEHDEWKRIWAFVMQTYRFRLLPEYAHPSMRAALERSRASSSSSAISLAAAPREVAVVMDNAKEEPPPPLFVRPSAVASGEQKVHDAPSFVVNNERRTSTSVPPRSAGAKNGGAASLLSELHDSDFPFVIDGDDFWAVVRRYVRRYVRICYPTDRHFYADRELAAFIDELCQSLGLVRAALRGGSPRMSRAAFVDILSQLIANNTGTHNHIGEVSEYLQSPDGVGTKLNGSTRQSLQTYTQVLTLTSLTGIGMPRLLDDFSPFVRGAALEANESPAFITAALTAYRAFRHELMQLQRTINARNGEKTVAADRGGTRSRCYPFKSFSPEELDVSAGV